MGRLPPSETAVETLLISTIQEGRKFRDAEEKEVPMLTGSKEFKAAVEKLAKGESSMVSNAALEGESRPIVFVSARDGEKWC